MSHQRKLLFSMIASLLVGGALLCALRFAPLDSQQPRPTPGVEFAPADAHTVIPAPDRPQDEVPAELFGYEPHPRETRAFLRTLAKPTIREAAPALFRVRGPPEDVFLYRSLYKAWRRHAASDWLVGKQGIGDCVSWGWAHAADIHLALMWELGDTSRWLPAATEAIYGGSRVEARGRSTGGYQDGSYGGAAAKWVSEWGILFRQDYEGLVDLSEYSASRAKDWGNYGCGGQGEAGQQLDTIAREHPVRDVALVRTFQEAAAAIASGYPIPVCSGQGFSRRRDPDGFCSPQGTWRHCMCFMAVRHGDRPGLLCLNSWGPMSVSGPKYPPDQPEGSFWVDADVADRMLRGSDSFAVSGYQGFPFRDLHHGEWVRVDPPAQPPAEVSILTRMLGGGDAFVLGVRDTHRVSHFALAP